MEPRIYWRLKSDGLKTRDLIMLRAEDRGLLWTVSFWVMAVEKFETELG